MEQSTQLNFATLAIAAILSLVITGLFCRSLVKTLNQVSPANRRISKETIWLLLVPAVNLVLNFFVVNGMSASLSNELESRNFDVDEKPGYRSGISFAVVSLLMLVFSFIKLPLQFQFLVFVLALAQIVFFVQYWARIRWYRTVLQQDKEEEADEETQE